MTAGYFYYPKYPELSQGTRVGNSCLAGQRRANRWVKKDIPHLPDLDANFDDLGLAHLAKAAYLLQPKYIGIHPREKIPPALPLLVNGIFIFMSMLLYFLLSKVFGNIWGGVIQGVIYLAPQVSQNLYSLDVYSIPLYAACFLGILVFASAKLRGKRAVAVGIAGAFGIYLCNFTRSSSWLVVVSLLPVLVFPVFSARFFKSDVSPEKFRRRVLTGMLVLTALMWKDKILHPGTGHPIWHSIHAGLLEFGGHIGPDQRIYPGFVPAAEIPPGAVAENTWNDYFEYRFARAVAPKVNLYSPEYGKILRQDYLRFWRNYPWDMLRLHAKRIWNIVDWDIWSWRLYDHNVNPNFWLGLIARAIFLGVFLLALFFVGWRQTLFAAGFVAPLSLSGVIVFSSYGYYQTPFRVCLFVFILFLVRELWRRYRGAGDPRPLQAKF